VAIELQRSGAKAKPATETLRHGEKLAANEREQGEYTRIYFEKYPKLTPEDLE